jgi:hypothetical protein
VLLVPLGVVTVTSRVPAVPKGATALMAVSDRTVKSAAGVPPKLTALAPVKPLPVMTTVLPPASTPLLPAMPLTVGAEAAL